MSTYSLSGSGIQSLSAGTTALHVSITTLPAGLTSGRANPTNHFDIGMLRFGDGTGYWAPFPIMGGPQWFGVPVGTTSLGYSLLNGAVVSVVEVIGGVSPFGFTPSVLHAERTFADGDVVMTTANVWYTGVSIAAPSGTYLVVARVQLYNSASTAFSSYNVRVYDGTTQYLLGTTSEHSNSFVADTTLSGTIVLAAAQTLLLQAQNTSLNGCHIQAPTPSTAPPGPTQMTLVKLA